MNKRMKISNSLNKACSSKLPESYSKVLSSSRRSRRWDNNNKHRDIGHNANNNSTSSKYKEKLLQVMLKLKLQKS